MDSDFGSVSMRAGFHPGGRTRLAARHRRHTGNERGAPNTRSFHPVPLEQSGGTYKRPRTAPTVGGMAQEVRLRGRRQTTPRSSEVPLMWVRLDDKFWADPTIEKIGNPAAGAYARMLSYCGDHLTDGVVTAQKASYIAPKKVIDRLAEFGLIVSYGDDWHIPGFLDFNPSREKVLAKREADKRRKAGGGDE